jgi:hypothetical protein
MNTFSMTMVAFNVMAQLAIINITLIDIKSLLYEFKK